MTYTQQERDRTVALAAVMQVTHLVHNIATKGQIDETAITPLLQSLLITDADSTDAVYGGISNLKMGLAQLNTQLVKTKTKHELTQIQYAVNLLRLERKLAKHASVMETLNHEFEQLPQQIEYYGEIDDPQVIARLADIYKATISNLTPFIKVYGEARYLENTKYANLVRALLLSGVRAAIIWHQKGGRYWQLLFQAKKIEQITIDLQASV